jgi:hypothetical protein
MSNSSLVHLEDSRPAPAVLASVVAEVDDDENAADLDDEDEIAPPFNPRWAAYPRFGSPEWWTS